MRPDQERIAGWLSERAPQLAEVYRGAIRLLDDPAFPGRHNFICHAARDIGNRVPDIITDTKIERVEMPGDLTTLVELWAKNGLDRAELAPALAGQEDGSLHRATAEITIPYQIFRQVQTIVGLQRQVSENSRTRARRMVEAVAPENKDRQEVLFPLINQWMQLVKWFVAYTHAGTGLKTVDEGELQSKFRTLEARLDAFIGEFFGSIGTLDGILEETNS